MEEEGQLSSQCNTEKDFWFCVGLALMVPLQAKEELIRKSQLFRVIGLCSNFRLEPLTPHRPE